jgi:hypothetical protein
VWVNHKLLTRFETPNSGNQVSTLAGCYRGALSELNYTGR